MIRYSKKSDINDIIFLWNEAFGDSEDDIMFFINNKYIAENTLVYETDGKIVSLLFLLEGNMKINGNMYPSYYLYAACTLNEYRGKGYMASLLEFAKKTAVERNKYFICLLPASKSLYGYYEKYGYISVFKKKIVTVNAGLKNTFSDFSNFESDDLFRLRENAYKNIDMFVWDKKSIEFAFVHHKLYGGQAFLSSKGYSLYIENGGEVTVKEHCFTDVFAIKDEYKETEFHMPVGYLFDSDNSEIVDAGMILPVNNDAEELVSEMNNPYLGLTLD